MSTREEHKGAPDFRDAGIAIVGMACIFPEAPSVDALWRNVVLGVDAVGEPPEAWEAARYLDSDRIETSAGGWLRDLFRFEPHRFGIMPNSIDGGEPDQFLALSVAREALRDAGYLPGDADHRDTGIVLGHSTYLHRGQGTLIQNHIVVDQTIDLLRAACPTVGDEAMAEVRALLASTLPTCNTDIAPGLVPNVMTGRIANRLDLQGPNYLVDAACSSSLLAVAAAMDELRAGRSSMMLAGGVNASLPPEVSIIFTQLGALSGRGKVRPFEVGSDGTLLGEGLGVVALKRLADALRDGDRVYAVLRGVGQASDGRGKGLLAPSEEGETLAIERAYTHAAIDPASVGLIEAHGTGIPLGDKTEVAALLNVFGGDAHTTPSLPVGSIKSMISHCIPAAGIAGLIKTALALHHKVLPPTLCDEVNSELGIREPLYVNTEATPWIHPSGSLRRAGINSFGFGGINTHAIVEQAPACAHKPPLSTPWEYELCVFSASDKAVLIERIESFAEQLAAHPEWTVPEIAAALTARDEGESHRLALVVTDRASLHSSVERALGRLRTSDAPRWSTRAGSSYSCAPLGGKLAFVFPGEGSQYLGMLADLALAFDDVRGWLDFWCGLYPEERGHRRTDLAFPPASATTPERREQLQARLHEMDVGSEAVFVGGQAMHSVLLRLGVTPDVMLGHSSGESSALAAAGAIPWEHRAELAEHVRQLNTVYRQVLADGKISTGALVAVGALPASTVTEQIEEVDPEIVVAMHNCDHQLVLFGSPSSIATLVQRLTDIGGICVPLPFDRGYHTPSFQGASAAFREYYDRIELRRPNVPLYSCASAELFPEDTTAIRDLAAGQWSTTVRFAETIKQMLDDGVTAFVEVGPSGNLTSFVHSILGDSEHLAVATNLRRRSGLRQLLTVLGQLYTDARPVRLAQLFAPRAISTIESTGDLSSDASPRTKGIVLDNTMPKIRLKPADLGRLQELLRGEPPKSAPSPSIPTSFLDAVVEHDAEHFIARCRLHAAHDAFLRDHVLSGEVSAHDPELRGLSCVPLMVSLEIMAEACAVLAGSPAVQVIENVRATGWIALDHEEVTLEVRSTVIDIERGRYGAQLMGSSGVVVSAEFGFALPEVQCTALPALTEHRESVWNDAELYTCGMFHGPLFQSIAHLEGWDDSGIDAALSPVSVRGFFREGEEHALVLNPVLLDAAGQLAAYWIAQFAGVEFNCFPSTIERIEIYAQCPSDVPGLRLSARQRPHDPLSTDIAAPRAWDFECVDDRGQPLVRITGLQNVYFSVSLSFYEVRRDPLCGWLGHPTRLPGREGVLLWELPLLSEAFCGQSEGIFLRILAHVYLGADERIAWHALGGSVRHLRKWLLGRACIKEVVRYWIYQSTGELLHPSEVVVQHDERGAPSAGGWWCGTLVDAPSISLSHDSTACIAALVDPVSRVGIDREQLGRIRKPELVIEALTPTEKTSLEGLDGLVLQDQLLRIWCAKEAAAKFLGLGLLGLPAAFEVQFADRASDSAYVGYAESSVYVDLISDDTSIIALASEPQ